MASAVLVSPFVPDAGGHGGNHRTYQILQDLEAVVGPGKVMTLRIATAGDPGADLPAALRPLGRGLGRVFWKLRLSCENPASLFARNRFYSRCFTDRSRVRDYRAVVGSMPRPTACVVEHAGLLDLVKVNREVGVPTIACPQNLESLDTGASVAAGRTTAWARSIDLSNELRALAAADHVLVISRVELALLRGLGARGEYYPYVPLAAVAARLDGVRERRRRCPVEHGLLLVLGSAEHRTTGEAMQWLLGGLGDQPLPAEVRIVVAGAGTEVFRGRWAGVEARGWLPQDELDDLLSVCAAALVPQRNGFGALCRLPELARAGVPVLVSNHALAALDAPPGCQGLPDDVSAWVAAVLGARQTQGQIGLFEEWERRQARPLAPLVERVLTESQLGGPGALSPSG